MKVSGIQSVWLLLALKAAAAPATSDNGPAKLPIIDLGYERHQAISFNETERTYNFSNIRYAQAPVGDLRFRAPVPLKGHSKHLNTGSVGSICPQPASLFSNPALVQWISAYIQGTMLDYDQLEQEYANRSSPASSSDPRVTEDCLFLDVVVPKKIFDKRGTGSGAPVLVWIHGGGYVVGEKTGFGRYNPAGMIQASRDAGDDGFIFVAINYRLGSFGFLAGSTLQKDGTPNAGLLDQRAALDWVKKNIHLFGGSSHRVTVMGESAGGGSILNQLTAYGGSKGSVPFQRIITQSAGIQPAASAESLELSLQTLFAAVNVSTMEELRAVPLSTLNAANTLLTSTQRLGFFGPAVDGTFVPEPLSALLARGDFDQSVTALIDMNSHEGILFSDPTVGSSAAYSTYIRNMIPGISNASASHIEEVLYPEVFDGSYGYTSQFERGLITFQELFFTCNSPILCWGLQNRTDNYVFAVPPGVHAQDVPYTFYNGPETRVGGITPPPTTSAEISIAGILQNWIATFVTRGTPRADGVRPFKPYGSDANVLVMGVNATSNAPDISRGIDAAFVPGRCAWLSQAITENTFLE
ncbi:Alpha/Beta hydrolase protein [Ilyonectria sp. MPI-CAGE-AT-0026]|nr:Alpha/Beta hydrolase protein [Ilyonectria sp. MPI-CAGE-AT-0026]